MNPDTTPTPFSPKHEAALASKTHAARRPSGVKAMATGLWKSEWEKPNAISDNFFLAHESLIIAADQLEQLERELAEKTNEVEMLRMENTLLNAEVDLLKQGKVFVDPKWIYDLESQLAKAHEELCQAGLREYGN
jgi:hypothetical protein